MKVPDDVILLFADDNWGQIRRLPTASAQRRRRLWRLLSLRLCRRAAQLQMAQYRSDREDLAADGSRVGARARSLWIVNVGDIKPMEFPLSFFMKQAWDPEAMTLEALARYPEEWARATFGPAQASAIANLVTRYSQYAARRKPELIDADSFRLGASTNDALDGGEFGALVAQWQTLEQEMRRVKPAVPPGAACGVLPVGRASVSLRSRTSTSSTTRWRGTGALQPLAIRVPTCSPTGRKLHSAAIRRSRTPTTR